MHNHINKDVAKAMHKIQNCFMTGNTQQIRKGSEFMQPDF
jgi:hypothetical protein